ncbi:MAG: hypothetical protein DRH30_07890 [Deltaproteobacteria bacterium]|nr:MAG: hypothetical protein DRH30_07890 [Deltaproteobacteria bacterium]
MKIGGNRGGGKSFPKADAGKYVAVCAGMYDIGIQMMSFPGQEDKPSERAAIVWELEAQQPDGGPFTLVDDLPLSLWKSSKMRQAAVALLDREVEEDEELDPDELIGKSCLITVTLSKKGNPVIALRAALQDASRGLKIQGKYGPEDEIHGLVAWHMRKAEEGTVPEGQGIMPTRKKREVSTAPQPGTTNGADDDDGDDIPF